MNELKTADSSMGIDLDAIYNYLTVQANQELGSG